MTASEPDEGQAKHFAHRGRDCLTASPAMAFGDVECEIVVTVLQAPWEVPIRFHRLYFNAEAP